MADTIQTENFESRPFHGAYINRKCLALTCPVEETLGKCFSRRKGWLNIFELNTWGSSTRRSLPGKLGGCLSSSSSID